MWFVGLVIGGLFGTAVGALVRWEEAWMLFAAIGAAGAIALKSEGAFSGKPVSEALERRIAALEREVQVLKAAHKAPATPAAAAAPPEASAPIETPEEAPASAPAVFEAAPVGVAPSTASAESHAEAAVASPHARDPLVMQTPAPKEPSWLAQKIFGGNILAKVGVVLLFFGIASGLKLAIDFGLFPASVRLLLATLAGIAMIGFGYTRTTLEKHRMFGLALQGGGFGVLYLVTYFALARYSFIDNATAFALFTALGIACLVVAVRLEGEPLAILGISGAFFAPLLASTGRGSHVVLFSFYAVLTVLVLGVNWLRAWRALTLTAFVFTLITGMTWASLRFERELFASTGAFLALFSVLFSGAAFASSFGRRATADHWADTVLLFGTPIAAAAAQSWLVERVGLGQTALAWSAVGAGLYYSALAAMLHARATAEPARAAHATIAVAFYTLAVPLAFGVQVTTAFWAIEGFVLAWFGVTRSRRFPYAAGLFLQLLAGGHFLFDWHDVRRMPVLNDTYVGCVVIAACGIATAWVTRRSKAGWLTGDWVTIFSAFAGAWALVWWLGANAAEIARFAAHVHKIALYVALLVATAWVLVAIGRTLSWPGARYVALR
ncbi:MAG: DUF2339 domain-containing protein, partial [Burkholderiales bacterium]